VIETARMGMREDGRNSYPEFGNSNQPQISQMAQMKKDRIESVDLKPSPAA
jgi:hypothetical protein